MPNKKLAITLIVPCYNEIANLQKGVLDKIGNFIQKDDRFIEVLIIDDGSTDHSRDMIEKYAHLYSKFRLIKNAHQGKAFAIITGISQAKGTEVIFSDIDLATPIEEVDTLIEEYEKGAEIVIGSRTSNREGAPLSRKILAYGLIMLRGIFLGLYGLRDTQCGFKMFQSEAAKNIVSKMQVFKNGRTISGASVSAGFDLEFLFIARKLGLTISEVTVVWRHVETKNVHFAVDALETLRDMAKIRYYHLSGKYTFNVK